MDSGLPRFAPKSALADFGTHKVPISGNVNQIPGAMARTRGRAVRGIGSSDGLLIRHGRPPERLGSSKHDIV
jgi:hypothetical protein